MSENIKRILVSLIGGPVILGSIYLGGVYFFIVVTIISLLCQLEFYNIAEQKNVKIYKYLGLLAGFALLCLYYLNKEEYFLPAILSISLMFFILELFSGRETPMLNMSLSVAGIIYPTLLIGTLYPLRQLNNVRDIPGLNLIIAILAGVWLCDTAAYYIGKNIGKHKLLPRVSPNKTWEGSAAGFIASLTAIASLKYYGFLGDSFTTVDVIMLSLFTGVGGQLGDLFESLIKRDAGVKDSGFLLPGHGGFLDRFDALIFAAPLAYLYIFYADLFIYILY
ncbi:phosphatidate cytidylyltransferase [Candidatus Marinimicrobia bacterium MT.SAG.3]|nr:phosphatidate cytidylyltransferase [Candidatus Marinimicrobia bacterium MT.SAG.3]